MSVLVTFTRVSPADPAGELAPYVSAVHCGAPMALVTPAMGDPEAHYTFKPADRPVELPPVWRCTCGFQLDAWLSVSGASSRNDVMGSEANLPALSA